MSFVLDSSVVLAALLPDEIAPGALAVLERAAREGAHAPALLSLELANGLLSAMRRQRIKDDVRQSLLADFAMLLIHVDDQTWPRARSTISDLAIRRNLTIYDAAYLELSLRAGVALATLDRKLAEAARQEGVTVLDILPTTN